MNTTLTNMQERASEWRATAEAAMVVRILTELAAEVSTKRFVRSRASRAERWQQLYELAFKQAQGLRALGKPSAVKRPRSVTKEPGAPTPEEQAAEAEARADAAANR